MATRTLAAPEAAANASALYVASGVLGDILRVTGAGRYADLYMFAPLASPHHASLLYAIANLAVLFVRVARLYCRRICLRV